MLADIRTVLYGVLLGFVALLAIYIPLAIAYGAVYAITHH